MSLLLDVLALAWAPLGAYGALVEGSMPNASRSALARTLLVA